MLYLVVIAVLEYKSLGMWAQATPCLSKGHISVLEQTIFVLQPAS